MDWHSLLYRTGRIVRYYQHHATTGLTVPEKYCLDVVPATKRGSILDIGVGGGRTTGPLSDMFYRYVGIDYSQPMIASAKRLHPDQDLRVMDARHLEFDDSFDCVMFSYNGIDSVSYPDRQLIWTEVNNVLKPGGYFIYSTRNLQHWRTDRWLNKFFVPELTESWRALALGLPNRLRNFRKQWVDDERGIASINDFAHRFTLCSMFVDVRKEAEVLKAQGLAPVLFIGDQKARPGFDSADHWVYIVARKT
jgi:SAM-dependent methyltransferase